MAKAPTKNHLNIIAQHLGVLLIFLNALNQ